jgi:hypothetical protein
MARRHYWSTVECPPVSPTPAPKKCKEQNKAEVASRDFFSNVVAALG